MQPRASSSPPSSLFREFVPCFRPPLGPGCLIYSYIPMLSLLFREYTLIENQTNILKASTFVHLRLPILQGGTFTFITPTLAILALPKWKCPKGNMMTPDLNATVASVSHIDPEEVWKMRIREVHTQRCFSQGVKEKAKITIEFITSWLDVLKKCLK